MSTHVSWMLELEIQQEHESALQSLMEEMVEATKANESGTLDYEWSISADGKSCHLFERYVDSAAALTHLGTFGEKYAGRFLEVFKLVRLVVYGSPSTAAQEALAGFNPVYMRPLGGFSR